MSPFFDRAIQFVPFLIVVLVIWLLVRPTFLRRFLSGIREKSIYRTERPGSRDQPIRRFALPYVAGLWCVFFLAGIALGTPALSAEDLQQYQSYRILLAMPCLIAAVAVHLRPNHSRELKYTLLLAPVPAVGLFLAGAELRDLGRTLDGPVEYAVWAILELISLWYLFAFIAVSLSLHSLVMSADTAGTASESMRGYVFAFLRAPSFGPLTLFCLASNPDVAIVLLSGRYVVVEAFRRHPIVYLRSFQYEGAATTFGRAIAPALAPFGVINALVHGSQTGRVLLAKTSIWQFGLLTTVSDSAWKNWVSHAIARCKLVVIDCTVRTESVDWEIETALRQRDPDRVLLMTLGPDAVVAAASATLLSYSADRAGTKRLRAETAAWAGAATGIDLPKARRVDMWVWLFVFAFIVARFLVLTYLLSMAA